MMYSATLLASLLASAHGFASTPTDGVECTRYDEYPEYDPKHFVYSVDQSLLYSLVASLGGPDFTSDVSVTRGLVGNTWQGLQLSITYDVDNTTITQAGGKPLTVTSPNTLHSGGFNVVSEDFCLGYGNWKVKVTASTHHEMASYKSGNHVNEEPILSKAVVDWAAGPPFYTNVNNFNGNPACESNPSECGVYRPFEVRWAIFPAEMRANATAAAGQGIFGMSFIEDPIFNWQQGLTSCEVDFEEVVVVPAPDHTCWNWDGPNSNETYKGPCPRSEEAVNTTLRRRLSVSGGSSCGAK